VFAVLSTFALISVACRAIWIGIRQKLSPRSSEPREYIFFNTQLGHYAACLLIGNTFVGIAGLIGIRWTAEKGITEGSSRPISHGQAHLTSSKVDCAHCKVALKYLGLDILINGL